MTGQDTGAVPDFGLMLFTHRFPGMTDGEVLRLAVDAAALAERVGFDAIWTTEHHFISYGANPSALAFAAYLLGRTETVRVGTAVAILPSHAPVHVAEQAALLDQLSGGRFDLGIGRGGPVVDYEVLGYGLDHWRTALPEALDLVLDSFAGPVTADSAHYRFRPVSPGPEPLTRPRPPVYVAATSEGNMELAAARRLPMLFFFHQAASDQAKLIARHAALCGDDAAEFRHGAAVLAHVTETRAEAERVVHDVIVPFFAAATAEYVLLDESANRHRAPEAMAEMFLRDHAIGPVELCVERLVRLARDGGARRLLLHTEASGEREAVLDNVRRLGEDVLPEVRRRLAG